MFELSNRRMNVIDRANELVDMAYGKEINDDDFFEEKNKILKDAIYIFNDDLISFLRSNFSIIHEGLMYQSINQLYHYNIEGRRDIKRIKRAHMDAMVSFQDNLFEKSKSYVHFHHERRNGIKQWFHIANTKRLQYDDQLRSQEEKEKAVRYKNSQWIILLNKIVSEKYEIEYEIPIESVLDLTQINRIDYYSWPIHMAGKNWVDYEEFEDAFQKFIELNPCISKQCDQDILSRSQIKARAIAQNKPIMIRF